MKFVTLIYEQQGELERLLKPEHDEFIAQHGQLQADARQQGVYLGAVELKPPATARTVRVKRAQATITDGPFVESKEYFIGLYLFECATLNEALALAGKIPTAQCGGMEVRPLDEATQCVDADAVVDQPVLDHKSLYALLIYHPENLLESYSDAVMDDLIRINTRMAEMAMAKGDYIGGFKLMMPTTATSMRGENGQRDIFDGPFSEAKEVLLGLHVLACQSFDIALDYARLMGDISAGIVEVRPINYFDQKANPEVKWSSTS